VRIFGGAELALGADLLETDATVTILGDTDVDRWTGMYCHDLGDVDGDGTADLLVAAYKNSCVLSGAELAAADGMQRHDAAITTLDHGDSAWADEGFSPGDLDGDGRDDVLLLNPDAELEVDGVSYDETIDLFLELGAGGTLTYHDADARLVSSNSSVDIISMAHSAGLREQGTDLMVAGAQGVFLLPVEELSLEGPTDLAGWDDLIAHDGYGFYTASERGRSLLAADLDGDGFDDVVAGNNATNSDFESDFGVYVAPGLISLFLNPID